MMERQQMHRHVPLDFAALKQYSRKKKRVCCCCCCIDTYKTQTHYNRTAAERPKKKKEIRNVVMSLRAPVRPPHTIHEQRGPGLSWWQTLRHPSRQHASRIEREREGEYNRETKKKVFLNWKELMLKHGVCLLPRPSFSFSLIYISFLLSVFVCFRRRMRVRPSVLRVVFIFRITHST